MLTWDKIIEFAKKGGEAPDQRVEKTEAEWRVQLTSEQFRVTRQHGTERPFSGE